MNEDITRQKIDSRIAGHFPRKWIRKSIRLVVCALFLVCAVAANAEYQPFLTGATQAGSPINEFSLRSQQQNSYLSLVYRRFYNVSDCSKSTVGTMLVYHEPDAWITPASVLILANDRLGVKGITGTGAPSEIVRDEWFGKLPGWTRSFLRGTYDQLVPLHATAVSFDMGDMYECFGYGPESAHQAAGEALNPSFWVPKAEALAHAAGKCLMYAPAVLDYEYLATPPGETQPREDLLAGLISQIAPHVDIWIIQLAKYQLWTDGGHDDDNNIYSMDDFESWVSWWVSWLKTTHPDIQVWTQLGIGKYDPMQAACLPPQPPEYILRYREALIRAGVDGVWAIPSQPCQPCPPTPSPGVPCSTDPQDIEYYQQSLAVFQKAIEIACGQ